MFFFIKYYNTAGKYSLFLSRYSSITIIDLIVKLRKHSLKKALRDGYTRNLEFLSRFMNFTISGLLMSFQLWQRMPDIRRM